VLHPAHGYRKDRLSKVRRAHGQVEFSGRNRTGLREHFVEAEKPSRPAGSVPEQRDGERPLCAHRPQVVEARLVGVLHGLVGKGGKFGAPELFPALFVVGEYPAKAFLQNALFELGGGVFCVCAAEVVGVGYEIGGFRRAFREVENRVELH